MHTIASRDPETEKKKIPSQLYVMQSLSDNEIKQQQTSFLKETDDTDPWPFKWREDNDDAADSPGKASTSFV